MFGDRQELERRADGRRRPRLLHRGKGRDRRHHRSLAVAYLPRRVRTPSVTMTERVKKLVAGNAALTRLLDAHLLGPIEPDAAAMTALDGSSPPPRFERPDLSTVLRRLSGTGATRYRAAGVAADEPAC
jgi:hypothetical protein